MSHDVGRWWETLAAGGEHRLDHISANFLWWSHISAPAKPMLDALRNGAAFASADAYLHAIDAIDAAIHAHNRDQDDHHVSLSCGPVGVCVDYSDSRAIADMAQADTRLARDIAASLAEIEPPQILLLRITCAEELLTAAIAARVLRARRPTMHVALIDHGYENFSLGAHLPLLAMTGALFELFDTVVAEKDEIDVVVPSLLARLGRGESVRGILRRGPEMPAPPASFHILPAPPVRCFAPPVLQMRLSPAGCYWGRCVYCTQNAKYAGGAAPSKAAIAQTIARMRHFVRAGCHIFVLADEALSPAMLRAFSRAIIDAGLAISWSCRSKLERSFDADLIATCARSGCREILFGVETTSPDLLQAMNKHVEGQSAKDAAGIFRALAAAGIGTHVNLINGFPGETLIEAKATVAWTIDTLRDHPDSTFGLNPFTVFTETPIAADPAAWGIAALFETGDMPSSFEHRLDVATHARTGPATAAFGELQRMLEIGLGWAALTGSAGGRSAFALYATSGHGVVFKSLPHNPIDAMRRTAPRPGRARRRAFLTGATGAVGGAVLAALIADDWDVLAMVRRATADPGCATLVADLADLPDLTESMGGMDAIIHCASPRSLNRSVMLSGEVEATGRLLDSWSSGSFLYASSQTVYGLPAGVLHETDPVDPDNWYDLAKIINEHQIAFTAERRAGTGVSLRLPLLFSAAVREGAGNYLIDLIDALERGDSFVFADQRAMQEDGSAYITDVDLGRAFVRATRLQASGTLNIASGFVTWRRLITRLGEIAGLDARFTIGDPTTPAMFRVPRSRTQLACTTFDDATGFVPTADLDDVLRQFVRARQQMVTRSISPGNPARNLEHVEPR